METGEERWGGAVWLFLVGLVGFLMAVLCIMGGCAVPTTPTGIDGRTPLGIRIGGGGSELHERIDTDWLLVNECWGTSLDPSDVTVIIMAPDLFDEKGLGVFKLDRDFYYGVRSGNTIRVCPDLAALKHEFSHLVGEHVLYSQVPHGYGSCWM